MKILLFSHLHQIREYAEYINAINQVAPVDTLFLTMGREEYELGRRVGAFDVVKDILPEQSELDPVDAELARGTQVLKELENRLGSCFVNQDILMDRYFRGQPILSMDQNSVPLIWTGSRARQFMYLIYKRLDEELRKFDPDFMFVETNYAPGRMAWRLARENGVAAGVFMPVRFWPDRVYLETGLGNDWLQARESYRELADKPMAGSELKKVEGRLLTIRQEKTKPAYLQSEAAKGAPGLRKRLYPSRLLAGLEFWLGKRARTFLRHPQVLPGQLFSPVAKFARYRNGLKSKRYLLKHQTAFDEFRSKKYAIYFLHVQPELTVEGMAFDYQDQVNTLRNVLAALPADMYLVVKEHSPMLGYRPLEVYNELVHMPGVIIAEAQEDSHKLITGSSVVVTLTGTVALEAVLYGIPAVVLGSIYFDCFKGVYKPDSLSELRQLLATPENLEGATEADALRALGSLLRASEPGRPARPVMGVEPIDLESAKVMRAELERFAAYDVRRVAASE